MLRSALHSSLPLLRSSRPVSLFTPSQSLTFARFLSENTRSQIQKAITSSPVVLFMKGTPAKPQCGFSRASIQILDLHSIPKDKVTTLDVLEHDELRSGIKEFSDWPTIPQLYVGGEFVGGCDILIGMHQSGELATLLESNNVIPKTIPTTNEPEPAPAS